MMIKRLLLLTDEADAAALVDYLRSRTGGCRVEAASNLAQLESTLATGADETRLLAFLSSVIVPAELLAGIPTAYNIHPGSPAYPGSYPACWAIYEGAARFGATLHEMTAQVDSGPIIDTHEFDLQPGLDSAALARQAQAASLRLLSRWAVPLLSDERPLPAVNARWSGRKRRVADLAGIAADQPGLPDAERQRRLRALAQARIGA